MPKTLEAALSKVILRHPNLCCGIIDEDTKTPAFIRLDEIDVSKRIEYETVKATSEKDYDEALMTIVARQHSQLWPDIDQLPPWKIIIIQPVQALDESNPVLDIAFFYHHAIADGMSGLAFHTSFLSALNSVSNGSIRRETSIVTPPATLALAPPVEVQIKFPISYTYILGKLWETFRPAWLLPDRRPAPWTGAAPSSITTESYTMLARLLTIPGSQVAAILKECRQHNTTLTGLLHGLVLAALAALLPSPHPITFSTPYSLRPWSKTAASEVTVQVSAVTSRYEEDLLSGLRDALQTSSTSVSGGDDLETRIWDIASDVKSKMTAELAAVPQDNIVGALAYVSDLHGMYKGDIARPRQTSIEVSNVGVLKTPAAADGNEDSSGTGPWSISRDVFTQCTGITGALLCLNVASVADGPLTISFTWLETAIDTQQVEDIIQKVEKMLVCISKGEKILSL